MSFKNEFQYSDSRYGTAKGCLRQYLFSYYFHWEGWFVKDDVEKALASGSFNQNVKRKLAWIFKKASGFYIYVGVRIHSVIEELLEDARKGKVVSPEDYENCIANSLFEFESDINLIITEQKSNRFLKDPKNCRFFVEYLNSDEFPYKFGKLGKVNWDKFIQDAKALYELNLRNFFVSGLYSRLCKESRESDLFEIEPSYFFNVSQDTGFGKSENIKIAVRPDLLTIKNRKLSVFDWKTGSFDNIKKFQAELYAYAFFKMQEWGLLKTPDLNLSEFDELNIRIFCLKENRFISEKFDPNSFDYGEVAQRLSRLAQLTDSGLEDNCVDISNSFDKFKPVYKKGKFGCLGCKFLRICDGAKEKLKL